MKIIIFSDLHIHNYRRFDNDGSRMYNTVSVLEDVFKYAHNNGIESIFFGGDLFDKPKVIHTEPFVLTGVTLAKLFKEYTHIKFYAIDGNHDLVTKNTIEENSISPLYLFDDLFDNFELINNQIVTFGGCSFLGVPYHEYAEDFLQVVTELFVDMEGSKYLLIHQTPKNANVMIPADFDAEIFKGTFDYVFCGHIHAHEQLTDNVVIIGSPLHRDMADAGLEKGFLVFDTDTNTYERINLDYPKFTYSEEVSEQTITADNYIMPKLKKIEDIKDGLNINVNHKDVLKQYLELVDKVDYFNVGKELL